jgi:hypothetical protein
MILYHFTFIKAMREAGPNNKDPVGDAPVVWTWSSGLRPGPKSMWGWSDRYFNPPPAVWFTNTPTPGEGFGRATDDGEQFWYELRLTVAMPPNSKRLVHWASYVRKHRGEEWWFSRPFTEAVFATLETFYCYFGVVDQSCIRAMDLVTDLRRDVPATLVPADLSVGLPFVPAGQLVPADPPPWDRCVVPALRSRVGRRTLLSGVGGSLARLQRSAHADEASLPFSAITSQVSGACL